MTWFRRSPTNDNNSTQKQRGMRPASRPRWVRPTLEQLESRTVPTGYLITGATPGTPAAIQSFAADPSSGALDQGSLQANAPVSGTQPAAAVAAGDVDGNGSDDSLAYVTRN